MEEGPTVDGAKFSSILMSLMFLARFTRPDILLAVLAVATRMKGPTKTDWRKITRIIKFLKQTPERGVIYGKVGDKPILSVFVDASHAVYPDGRGQGGIVITLVAGPIMTNTWKLKHVTLSSTESEVSVLSEAATFVI